MSEISDIPQRAEVISLKVYIRDAKGNIFQTTIETSKLDSIFFRPPEELNYYKLEDRPEHQSSTNKLEQDELRIKTMREKFGIGDKVNLNEIYEYKGKKRVEQTVLGKFYESHKANYEPCDDRCSGAAYVASLWCKEIKPDCNNWGPLTQAEYEALPKAKSCEGKYPYGLTAMLKKSTDCPVDED